MNIIPRDEIDNEAIRLTTPIPLVCNHSILATPVINVSATPHSSQRYLTMQIPMLSSKLASLETNIWQLHLVLRMDRIF